jgi:cephalosporin hydroxylase
MSHTFKQIAPTDHFGWHAHYLTAYERLFKSVDHGSVLEIGCDGGGGILSYAEWFSRQAGIFLPRQFVSCDISPRPASLDANKQIIHYQGDAYQLSFIEEVLKKHGPFAVIVEDGPHTLGSQEFFVQHYTHLLTERGIALIEDIQRPEHVPYLIGKIPQGFVGYAVDLRHTDDRYDSLILAIERK